MPGETANILSEQDLVRLHRLCMRNRSLLRGRCGCFYCLSTFPSACVGQWTDEGETALCPVCGIDAVLPETGMDIALLEQMHERWFARTVRVTKADWDRMATRDVPS